MCLWSVTGTETGATPWSKEVYERLGLNGLGEVVLHQQWGRVVLYFSQTPSWKLNVSFKKKKKKDCFLYQDKATSGGGSFQVSWISYPTQEEQEAVWRRG